MVQSVLNSKSRIALFGVFAGDFALWIQEKINPAKLYAIDTYEDSHIQIDEPETKLYASNILEWFANCRIPICKQSPVDFLKSIPDGHLDMIYIDSYELKDIDECLDLMKNKLKTNGWIIYRNCDANQIEKKCKSYKLDISICTEDPVPSFGIQNKKNKIHIVSLSNRPILYSETFEQIKKYANFHTYTCKLHTDLLDSTRHPSWNKIPAILQALDECDKKQVEYIIWMDDDILITDLYRSIYDFIDTYNFRTSNAITMVCEDINHTTLMNCGMMIFKNSEETVNLLKNIWDLGSNMPIQIFNFSWEQEVFNFYYKFLKSENILIIPHKTMQSLARPDTSALTWSPGDFAAHISIGSIENRLQVLDLVKPRYCNNI